MRRGRIIHGRCLATALALAAVLAGCAPPEATECVGEACLPGSRCETDAQCDDGLVCNGTERCGTVSRRCVSGVALDCDDGVECTVDQCMEPDGACSSLANAARCASGEVCTGIEGTGCVRRCTTGGVACDPIEACGCRPDQACTYGSSGMPTCGAAGTGAHGEPCATSADCVAGTQCIPLDGTGALPASYAECRALCRSERDCPGESECSVPLPGTTTRACAAACNLVTQTGCSGPTGCHPVGFPGSGAYADCVVVGDRIAGASCGTASAVCAAGLICVTQTSGGAICDRICRFDRDCTGGRQCLTLSEPLVVGGVEFGICN